MERSKRSAWLFRLQNEGEGEREESFPAIERSCQVTCVIAVIY